MADHLYGIHDWSPAWGQMVRDAGVTAWCVTTHALSEQDRHDYRPLADYNVTPIARLNHGYGSTGTIPTSDNYAHFAETCAEFVARSPGCHCWIIGNEPNHAQERPDGLSITPEMYADCFLRCRDAIRREAGTQQQVIPAAIAPWNVSSGDWIEYFAEVMRLTGGGDGIALHTYTHGAYTGLITSEARMDPPYEDRRYEFRAYLDFLHALPSNVPDLPVYITETDQTQEWIDQDNGWTPAAYHEIARYNRVNQTRRIHALVLYRWPNYDIWGFENKPGVHAGFRAALAQDYRIPRADGNPSPQPRPAGSRGGNHTIHMPIMHGNGPTEPQPAPEQSIEWDSRLTELGVRIKPADVQPGEEYWRVVRGQWLDEDEADRVGPDHHILVDVLDENGERLPAIDVYVEWPDGHSYIQTQMKPGEPYAADYPMSTGRNAFRVQIPDQAPSDEVVGIGMGALVDGGFNAGIHTSTVIVFQRTTATADKPQSEPTAADPAPQPTEPISADIINPVTALAFLEVESGNQPFMDGLLTIRVEIHRLQVHLQDDTLFDRYFKFTPGDYSEQYWRPAPDAPWRHAHGAMAGRHELLTFARSLDDTAALLSTGMGMAQIMGANHARVGFNSPQAMFRAFGDTEFGANAQLVAFFNYLLSDPWLLVALRQGDWWTAVQRYNGVGQEEYYISLLTKARNRLKGKIYGFA